MSSPRRHPRPSRPSVALTLLLAVVLAAALSSGCGDGGNPAPIADTLTPTPATSNAAVAPAHSPRVTPSATGGTPAITSSPPAAGQTPSGQTATTLPSPAPSTSNGTVTDKAIKADILRRLAASPVLVGLTFKVVVHKGVVVLAGTARTKIQKTTAEQIAVTEPGVKKVVSYVKVVPGGGGY